MGALQEMERKAWDLTTGVSHPHYRQAIWRPLRQSHETFALGSQRFAGDPNARGGLVMPWQRKAWGRAGIVAVNANVWSDFVDEHATDSPVVIFANPKGLRGVGKLKSYNDIGTIERYDGEVFVGHGMRLGPTEVQFGLGAISARGEVFTPDVDAYIDEVADVAPIPVAVIGAEGTAWQEMNFS